MRSLLLLLFLFPNILHAAYIDKKFIRNNLIPLAQFLAYHEEISFEEFLRMEVMEAEQLEGWKTRDGKNPNLYVLYTIKKDSPVPRFYYFVDRDHPRHYLLWQTEGPGYFDTAALPYTFWPEAYVDKEIKDDRGRPDSLSYSGAITPMDVNLGRLRTTNGYEIDISRHSLHGPRGLIDQKDFFDFLFKDPRSIEHQLRLNLSVVPRTVVSRMGMIEVEDTYSKKKRRDYIIAQELALLQRNADPEWHEALALLFARMDIYVQRSLKAERKGDKGFGKFMDRLRLSAAPGSCVLLMN